MSIHELLMKWLNIAATTKYSENFVTNFDGLNLRDECKKIMIGLLKTITINHFKLNLVLETHYLFSI